MVRKLIGRTDTKGTLSVKVSLSAWDNRWREDGDEEDEPEDAEEGEAGQGAGGQNENSPARPEIPRCLDGYTEQLPVIYEASTSVGDGQEGVWVEQVHDDVLEEMMMSAPPEYPADTIFPFAAGDHDDDDGDGEAAVG